jgi:regulator of RNase E activity RraA
MSRESFEVHSMPPQIGAPLLDRLQKVETATVGHFRLHGFMNQRLRPIQDGTRIAGTAVTVRTVGIDSTALLLVLDHLRPGDVLVVDRCGEDRHAAFGAVMSAAVRSAGVAGVVIDGRACDFSDIRGQGMPLWCAGPSPMLGRRLDLGGGVNVPVSCGGVTVNPGDAVLADDTGILVIPPEEVEAVAAEGLKRQAREAEVLQRMEAGEKLSRIADFPRFADYLKS